jgi:hypothetical protein
MRFGPMSPHVLDSKELAALGSVVVESTFAESLIETLISEMSKLDKGALVLFLRGAMMNTKLELLADLGKLKLRSAKRKEAFAEIISRLKHLNSERVIAVHGVWAKAIKFNAAKGGTGMVTLASFSDPMNIEFGPSEATHPRGGKISAKRLEALATQISDAYWDLYEFHAAVWVKPYAKRRVASALQSKSRGLLSQGS